MINGVVLTMLSIESIADIRSRSVSVLRQAIFWVFAVIFNIEFYYQTLSSVLGGMALGIFLLLVAYVTREGIGYGDGLVFIVTGTYVGLAKNAKLLFASLVVAAVAGIGVYLFKKRDFKAQLPFLPCVLIAYIIEMIIEHIKGGTV